MRTIRNILSTLFLLSLNTATYAVIYYVSPTGSDANAGTSTSAPWATIDKVNLLGVNLHAGDQVQFQRGGTFRGELLIQSSGTSSLPILIGSYGTGADPIFSGSKTVTGWTAYSGNIWRAPVTGTVAQVYVGGVRMQLARWPNTGWMHNQLGTTATLHDPALTQAANYWVGAQAVIRTTNWSYDNPVITSFSGGTLGFGALWYNLTDQQYGYYMCNKLSELDMAGEWFYESASGYLYLWAPSNANPNTLGVEATTKDIGLQVSWQKQYVNVTGLKFMHYKNAGILVNGASHISVSACTFQEVFHGVKGVGDYNSYTTSTYTDNYATGADLQDNYVTFNNNTMTNIAMVAGQGENSWGYFGVHSTGTNCTIRSNNLLNIGYVGISAEKNGLVEKNVVDNATGCLNDGSGIGFDFNDGMVVQDNIVRNCTGNIESMAPNSLVYFHIGHGIYFGNTFVKNTTVQRNTVYNCAGSGLNVDHAMANTGNAVLNNTFFNNIRQLSVSDFSNNVGQGAVAPYYVPLFNETYSGNIMYSMAPDQLCMHHFNCYSTSPTDFGTFSNNKYFNPYNEQVIMVYNLLIPEQAYYTVAQWQVERNEDVGSTASPLHQNLIAATSDLSGNLVTNGDFTSNVTGWTAWPTNAQVTRVTTHLDNGCLKALIPNNSLYFEQILQNPDQTAVTNGQWYRMRFSIQSDGYGDLKMGLKGQSQFGTQGFISQVHFPFSPVRRDEEFFFQSNLTDNAHVMAVNQWSDPQYYLDNVQVHRVAVTTLNAADYNKMYVNDQSTAQNFTLPAGCWSDVNGTVISGTFTLQPYTSRIFYAVTPCNQNNTGTVSAKVELGGSLNWNTGIMRDDLRVANKIPSAEPYTALGYATASVHRRTISK